MTERAWYLGCGPDDVGDRALLVGDRGRVAKIADLLGDVTWLNEDRGLTTATGTFEGRRVTVSAFGMGAPIAAIVLHELADLGVRIALRLGTVMCLPPAQLGDLVIADGGLRGEATSAGYAPPGYPAVADHTLGAALRAAADTIPRRTTAGIVASYDAFYPGMATWRTDAHAQAEAGVVARDMETSALLVVGRHLGVATGSLCLATVDGLTGAALAEDQREAGEHELVATGLAAITAIDDPPEVPRRPAKPPAVAPSAADLPANGPTAALDQPTADAPRAETLPPPAHARSAGDPAASDPPDERSTA